MNAKDIPQILSAFDDSKLRVGILNMIREAVTPLYSRISALEREVDDLKRREVAAIVFTELDPTVPANSAYLPLDTNGLVYSQSTHQFHRYNGSTYVIV